MMKRMVDNSKNVMNSFNKKEVNEKINDFICGDIPVQLGYGFVMGYTSGFCVKKVSIC